VEVRAGSWLRGSSSSSEECSTAEVRSVYVLSLVDWGGGSSSSLYLGLFLELWPTSFFWSV
jgi:hypothetical protein